jgi:hypothetical protein
MPVIDLTLEESEPWTDLTEKNVRTVVGAISIAGFKYGMESGRPSVGIRMNLDDGTCAIASTSLRLFLTAADALKARYGDPR